MILTRRDFGKVALASVSGLSGLNLSAKAQAGAVAPNRSLYHGVQFGLQPFCYHDLPMNTDNRSILIERMVQNGLGMVELHATWVEPRFEGVPAQEARNKIRDWRLNPPPGYYRSVKKEFDD